MFDKLKEAVGDILEGNANTAEKSVAEASGALDKATSQAEGVVDSVTASTDGASIDALAGALGGIVNQVGGLEGIANELGGLSGILDMAKQVDFPIGVDDLEPLLAKFGISGQGSDIVQNLVSQGISQIDSPDDLINIAKQFLAK